MSRAHLARQLAAAITRTACKGQGEAWTEWEAAHADAVTPAQAEAAAAPALAVCAGCPEVTPGGRPAPSLDSYTGVAAGTAWVNGMRRPTPDFAHSRQAERRRQEKARTLARWSCVRSPPGPDKTKVAYCRKTDGTIPLGLPLSLIHISEPTRLGM